MGRQCHRGTKLSGTWRGWKGAEWGKAAGGGCPTVPVVILIGKYRLFLKGKSVYVTKQFHVPAEKSTLSKYPWNTPAYIGEKSIHEIRDSLPCPPVVVP